ncbi:porin family protein [Sulfurovum sp. ST-21]|uniref:Porin family protein n=1 Tax=Sulfurovum indicum TaxID=2779528 RepID=A0A7M1S812_9BACT|nr:porin family protein [Sulfurovum indicum]QOR62490.1 porin family protein [Sulfurovum indicum]
MKKGVLSLVSILALNGVVYAGGNIVLSEPAVEVPAEVLTGFYVGVGLGQADVDNDTSRENWDSSTLLFQAGYQFNPYVAVEGRYSFGFNMDYDKGVTLGTYNGIPLDNDFSSWGLYLKPIYPIGNFNLYALLGYGGLQLSDIRGGDAYEDGLQWGLGTSYSVTERISVFMDYVSLYDDTGFDYVGTLDSWNADTWTIGISYKF